MAAARIQKTALRQYQRSKCTRTSCFTWIDWWQRRDRRECLPLGLFKKSITDAPIRRSLVYLALDGVAPRAKMNQQRARRWKAAKDAAERRELEAETRAELTGSEVETPRAIGGSRPDRDWDSNVITPGTTFMTRLAESIRRGVVWRQQRGERYWRDVAVVLSDASVPGEGEHKIMAFVRALRTEPNYNPNTTHLLHGLDADLIMLALATHEINFSILREEILFGRAAKQYEESAKAERNAHAQLLAAASIPASSGGASKSWIYTKPLQMLKIATLREYLMVEFNEVSRLLGSGFDFENVIDDFVFFCFFCGNDFLPHLPSLDIREGALDLLLRVYKAALPTLGGYVTSHGGKIDMRKLGRLLRHVGAVEDEIFKRRRRNDEDDRARRKARKLSDEAPHGYKGGVSSDDELRPGSLANAPRAVLDRFVKRRLAAKESAYLDKCSANFVDEIRLGEAGWKARYYGSKYVERDIRQGGGLDELYKQYVRGLDWVLRYYYAGCRSWSWYFPFHYAPFASDLCDFVNKVVNEHDVQTNNDQQPIWIHNSLSANLELGTPFTPLQQLLAVLPAASAHALPLPCRDLMLSPSSPIRDFYTDDVDIDPNGKAMPWLHVVLLPFIEERRIVEALDSVKLDPADAEDGSRVSDALIFARREHSLAARLMAADNRSDPCVPTLIVGDLARPPRDGASIAIDARIPEYGIQRCEVACAVLKPPVDRLHQSVLLPGAVAPPRVLFDHNDLFPRPPPRIGRRGAASIAELADVAVVGQHSAKYEHEGRSGLNTAALRALAQRKHQRTWGTFEPQIPLKRPHLQYMATAALDSPSYNALQQTSDQTAATSRHTFAHPGSSAYRQRSSAYEQHAASPVQPAQHIALDNVASANSLRAQLAQALRRKQQQYAAGQKDAPS